MRKFKISHVILEGVHRFRKLHKRTSQKLTSPANGPTKGKNEKNEGERWKQTEKVTEEGEKRKRKEVERAASRGNWPNSR